MSESSGGAAAVSERNGHVHGNAGDHGEIPSAGRQQTSRRSRRWPSIRAGCSQSPAASSEAMARVRARGGKQGRGEIFRGEGESTGSWWSYPPQGSRGGGGSGRGVGEGDTATGCVGDELARSLQRRRRPKCKTPPVPFILPSQTGPSPLQGGPFLILFKTSALL